MTTVSVMLIVACCFLAAILNLALQSRYREKVMAVSACSAIFLGVFFYSYAYTFESGFSAITILKSLLTICRMFGGVNDYAALSVTPLFRYPPVIALFWLGHFFAFYVTASAAIEFLGRRLLKGIRLLLLRKGKLTIFYGATPETFQLGRKYNRQTSLIYVVDNENETTKNIVDSLHGVLFSGGPTLCTSKTFLKSIGIGKKERELNVFCMSDNHLQNMEYASGLLRSLSELNVNPDMTSLFLLGVPETKATHLMAIGNHYGYGFLMACEQYELIARLLIKKIPPWTRLHFDTVGRATNDFNVIIVGFGQMGRAVLRHIVMNGQMEGSTFHAEVFDRQMDNLQGYMEACYPALLQEYDIRFHSKDARSASFYNRLSHGPVSMVVLCTSSRKQNEELALDLERWFAIRNCRPPVVQCSYDSVIVDDIEFHASDLDVRNIDHMAMVLNHVYMNGPSEEIDWRNCDPFSRASSRASADFYPAILYASGITAGEALDGKWPPSAEMLENLARTEHRRWNAFHLSMGYRPMSENEYEERVTRYLNGEKIRITKNTDSRTHACLVSWEDLDRLSARESEIFNKPMDYKAPDRNNVLAIPDMIRKERNDSIGKK